MEPSSRNFTVWGAKDENVIYACDLQGGRRIGKRRTTYSLGWGGVSGYSDFKEFVIYISISFFLGNPFRIIKSEDRMG